MTDDGDEDRPRRQPLDIADQIIAPQLEPLVRKAGHGDEKFGDRYIHLIGPTLYHLRLGDYFHSRASAERAYAEATREPYREPTPVHERFA